MTKNKRGRPVGSFKSKFPCRINGVPTVLYRRWQGMKGRCENPNSHIWKYYGGRGITVCERWSNLKDGYANFAADMGEPPVGTTLDRIDNSKGYEPGNCRWATWQEQANNKRPAKFDLDPESLYQRAKAVGLPYSTLYQRVKILGWSLEKALATPHLGRGKPVGGWVRTSPATVSTEQISTVPIATNGG